MGNGWSTVSGKAQGTAVPTAVAILSRCRRGAILPGQRPAKCAPGDEVAAMAGRAGAKILGDAIVLSSFERNPNGVSHGGGIRTIQRHGFRANRRLCRSLA